MHNSPLTLGTIFSYVLPFLIFGWLLLIFGIYMLWRIFKKTGQHGALSLLTLIPGIGLYLVLAILAFGKWPSKTEVEQHHMSHGVVSPTPATQGYPPQG